MHFSENVKMCSKPARKEAKEGEVKKKAGEGKGRRRKANVRSGTADRRHYIDFTYYGLVNVL
jgi:hypothetical protein